MGPSRRIELRLAVYRTATLQSVDGDGDQPWDRTTFSRSSAERYDHTSSLVLADAGSRTRSSCVRSRHAAVNTSSTLVQARGFAPRSSDNRSEVLLLDEAWVLGASGRSRTCLVPLKRRSRGRCVTLALHDDERARWLADVGSNHDLRIQSPPSCRWTICQWWGRGDSNPHVPAPEAGGLPITQRPHKTGTTARARTGTGRATISRAAAYTTVASILVRQEW